MFWDVMVLGAYLLLNIVIAWFVLDAEHKSEAPPSWVKPLILLSIPWAISIHTVTAFLYNGLAARPFWFTALLAPRFLASAFASGPSLLILMCLIIRRVTKFDPGSEALQKLAQIVTYAIIASVFKGYLTFRVTLNIEMGFPLSNVSQGNDILTARRLGDGYHLGALREWCRLRA